MRTLRVTFAAACLVSATAAWADGMPRRDRVVAYESPMVWSGAYVGLHAGAGWSDSDWRFATNNFYGPAGTRFSTEPDGGLVGGHIGYNHQWGSWVAGIEVSYSGAMMRDDATGFVPAFPQDKFTARVEDLFTVTGRIGYATPTMLWYAKGGYANGEVELSAISGPPVANTTFSTDERLNGWTVGGGFEYRIHRNLSLGIEYNYVHLGGETFSARTQGTAPGLPVRFDADDVTVHTVMARLNLLIGH